MAQLTASVAQAQPTSPRAGRPAPPKANQIDSGTFTQQRAQLQPGHELRLAQALVERAEQPEQQRRRQREGQHREVGLDVAAHRLGHLGPAQQRRRETAAPPCPARWRSRTGTAPAAPSGRPRRCAARHAVRPRPAAAPAARPSATTKTLMKMAAPTDSAASALFGIAAGDDGVGHAEGHHGELADQHRARVARDDARLARWPPSRRDALVEQQVVARAGRAAQCADQAPLFEAHDVVQAARWPRGSPAARGSSVCELSGCRLKLPWWRSAAICGRLRPSSAMQPGWPTRCGDRAHLRHVAARVVQHRQPQRHHQQPAQRRAAGRQHQRFPERGALAAGAPAHQPAQATVAARANTKASGRELGHEAGRELGHVGRRLGRHAGLHARSRSPR